MVQILQEIFYKKVKTKDETKKTYSQDDILCVQNGCPLRRAVPPQQPVNVDGAVVLVGGSGIVLECTSRSGEIE